MLDEVHLKPEGFLTSTAKVLPPYRDIVDEYVEYLRHDRALADHAGWPYAARSGDRRNHSDAEFLASHYPVGIRHRHRRGGTLLRHGSFDSPPIVCRPLRSGPGHSQ